MKIDLTGKKAIVCGGSRGIGKAIALGFAAAAATSRSAPVIPRRSRRPRPRSPSSAARPMPPAPISPRVTPCAAMCSDAVAALGGVDFLVNNASAFGSSDDDKGWGANLAVDMMAIVHATQEAYPALKQVQGSVVNISSIAAFHPAARQPPYGAIKAAVVHYTATQAAMYAKDRVRVTASPRGGSIEFPGGVWDRRKTSDPKLYNATLASIPVRPHGLCRGGRQRGAVPGVAVGIMGHRPGHLRSGRAGADGGRVAEGGGMTDADTRQHPVAFPLLRVSDGGVLLAAGAAAHDPDPAGRRSGLAWWSSASSCWHPSGRRWSARRN